MNDVEDRIITEAAAWHAASDGTQMDWDGFTSWLEADPRHVSAYDEVALVDSLIGEHRLSLRESGDSDSAQEVMAQPRAAIFRRSHKRLWAGAAIAASLTAVFVIPNLIAQPTVYETQSKSQRIALADGSSITLAPHSRLSVAGSDQDQIALSGGAWFDIRHRSERTMAITAGELEIRDIGTSFDVQAEAKKVRIGVSDGEVTVAAEALSQPIRLQRGRSLLFDSGEGTALVTPLAGPEIGTWRNGRLSYEDTPLPLVLGDLSRYAGLRVTLPDALRSRRFSGSLIIGDGQAAIRDLAEVMDLQLAPSGDGYRLSERKR